MAEVGFPSGRPSSALPDKDGRHDRTGHGTWVLLAVFVAHDDRPWLSVTGTSLRVSACAPGMDPRACDGRTTVCPLWLLGGPLASALALQARAVEFFHLELFRVDAIQAAHVEHHHVPAARPLTVGVRL